jgi:hypothetical protein
MMMRHLLATALCLTALTACASDPPVVASGATSCDRVASADKAANTAMSPLITTLAGSSLSSGDVAKATEELRTILTNMHLEVAAAAEGTGDEALKTMIHEYQYSVEQAIVILEGSDGDPAQLAGAIELPTRGEARMAVMAACAGG